MLLVRARRKGDIEAVFTGFKARRTPGHDYPYRAVLQRTVVAEKVLERVLTMNYANFKGSVSDPDRHEAYFGVWARMREYQLAGESEPS